MSHTAENSAVVGQLASRTSRREWLAQAGLAMIGLLSAPRVLHAMRNGHAQALPTMTVFKSPTCGCCKAWVTHAEKAGFKCVVRDMEDLTEVKRNFAIPRALESCHTVQVGTYLVEGHVPADLVIKMLRDKPVARGLAVPGMPVGSPGMEGGTPERYQVLLFDKTGNTTVYATR
jgi:hypothetical protein